MLFRRTIPVLSKRTPGYVFWRQSTLNELEHSKRNYLLSERPVPLAEVARRMVRVKARFQETADSSERNLLRGEYKYFTGKVCDIRAARPTDMIAFLQCASFFGIWDTAQVERVMHELLLRMASLSANELVCLFVAMPGLRKQQSELYKRTAVALVDAVPDLTLTECLAVCEACTSDVPEQLTYNVLRAVEPEVDAMEPSQWVDVLDTVLSASTSIQMNFQPLCEAIKKKAMDSCKAGELSCMDLAVLHAAMKALNESDAASQAVIVKAFVAQEKSSCARSTAMVFSSVGDSLGVSLPLAHSMADRVLFLATDFTSPELLAVFQVYLNCLTSMCTVANSLPATEQHHSQSPELSLALQRQRSFKHVLSQLSEQLASVLQGAAAYLSPAQQMELLHIYATAVEDLSDMERGAASSQQLLHLVPQTRTVMQQLSNKLVANMRLCTLGQLVGILEYGNTLGPSVLPDVVVTAAVQQLLVGDWCLAAAEASQVSKALTALTDLRAEHQARINASLVPKLRKFI